MSLINKLFGKLFGNKPTTDDYVMALKTEQERIQAVEQSLKGWIIDALKEKGSLPFTWESGNDEAFITFNDSTEAEAKNFYDLEDYIIDKLNIPSAGEFEMTGSGSIYIAGNLVRVKYNSTAKAIIDYDEATEQEIYSEEEQDSGDKILFAI